jgi:catechol-2,3-dioxygenase
MGLFYSMMSYFKSFYGTQPLQLNETKIVLSANKLIHTLKLKQLQVQKEAKSL